jgi:hypothetical protein
MGLSDYALAAGGLASGQPIPAVALDVAKRVAVSPTVLTNAVSRAE